MKTALAPSQLDTLAAEIDRSGFSTISVTALNEIRFTALNAGVSIAVADVLVDPTAPAVLRSRAFGFIATALDRSHWVAPTAAAA